MLTPPPDFPPPIVEQVQTADAALISVKRRHNPGGAPVIFLHGLATNADLWDMPTVIGEDYEYRSLAGLLFERGCDIWLMNIRGHGGPHMLSLPPPGQTEWYIDESVLYDLPAVVDHVCQQTGRRPVLIGCSLGAMIMSGYLQGAALRGETIEEGIVADEGLARRRAEQIAGAVFVEPPATLRWPHSVFDDEGALRWNILLRDFWRTDGDCNFPFELMARWEWLERQIMAYGKVPFDRLRPARRSDSSDGSSGASRLMARVERSMTRAGLGVFAALTGNRNLRAEVILVGRRYVLDGVKSGVLQQLARCVRERRFVSWYGGEPHVYSEHYHLIGVPSLVIAGGRDRIANAEIAREVLFERLGSADKQFRLYEAIGHGEFSSTPIAVELVYPDIVNWLENHVCEVVGE